MNNRIWTPSQNYIRSKQFLETNNFRLLYDLYDIPAVITHLRNEARFMRLQRSSVNPND